nr:hypothetical protein DA06_13865 [Georgenia sp. SUBG003]
MATPSFRVVCDQQHVVRTITMTQTHHARLLCSGASDLSRATLEPARESARIRRRAGPVDYPRSGF